MLGDASGPLRGALGGGKPARRRSLFGLDSFCIRFRTSLSTLLSARGVPEDGCGGSGAME